MIPNPPDTHYAISVTNPPACVDLKPNVYEVEHQGTVGSCTANAVVEALEALRKEDYSRLYLYWQTRNGVQNAPKQIGTNVRDTLRAAAHFGVPLEADWPYIEANVDEQPSDAVVLKAQERKLKRYERVPSVVMPAVLSACALHAYFKSALAEGLPIVATMYIGTALYDLKGPWQTHNYASVSAGGNPYLGMHAVRRRMGNQGVLRHCGAGSKTRTGAGKDHPWLALRTVSTKHHVLLRAHHGANRQDRRNDGRHVCTA